jgi:hypothetical protein
MIPALLIGAALVAFAGMIFLVVMVSALRVCEPEIRFLRQREENKE